MVSRNCVSGNHRVLPELARVCRESSAGVGRETGSYCGCRVAWYGYECRSPPATRYYFDDRADWRNAATFTFDLAMVCRGLHAVRRLVPEHSRRDVLQKLLRHVMPTSDVLPVFINMQRELPDRWSTRPGPFQLKTAAALLSIQEHPAFWKMFYRWNGRVLDGLDAGELHAAFMRWRDSCSSASQASLKPSTRPRVVSKCFLGVLMMLGRTSSLRV